jgi:hypothetical protein
VELDLKSIHVMIGEMIVGMLLQVLETLRTRGEAPEVQAGDLALAVVLVLVAL